MHKTLYNIPRGSKCPKNRGLTQVLTVTVSSAPSPACPYLRAPMKRSASPVDTNKSPIIHHISETGQVGPSVPPVTRHSLTDVGSRGPCSAGADLIVTTRRVGPMRRPVRSSRVRSARIHI